MITSREVNLLLDTDGAELPVLCVVSYDPEGVDDFIDGLMYCIRTDTNMDIVDSLSDEQLESIEYQLTSTHNPYGDEDGTDEEY